MGNGGVFPGLASRALAGNSPPSSDILRGKFILILIHEFGKNEGIRLD
jgi:hypothetical protein